jgi:hypothetical protein
MPWGRTLAVWAAHAPSPCGDPPGDLFGCGEACALRALAALRRPATLDWGGGEARTLEAAMPAPGEKSRDMSPGLSPWFSSLS